MFFSDNLNLQFAYNCCCRQHLVYTMFQVRSEQLPEHAEILQKKTAFFRFGDSFVELFQQTNSNWFVPTKKVAGIYGSTSTNGSKFSSQAILAFMASNRSFIRACHLALCPHTTYMSCFCVLHAII